MLGDVVHHSLLCWGHCFMSCHFAGMHHTTPPPPKKVFSPCFPDWLSPLFPGFKVPIAVPPPSVLPFRASVMACRDIHLTSHRDMRTSVPTDSESGCTVHSRHPRSSGPGRTHSRAFATLDLGKLHSSVKLVFLIPHSQPLCWQIIW